MLRRRRRSSDSKKFTGGTWTSFPIATSTISTIKSFRRVTRTTTYSLDLLAYFSHHSLSTIGSTTPRTTDQHPSIHLTQTLRPTTSVDTAEMGTLRSIKKVIHPTKVDKNNPYSHPSHPNHNPIIVPASKTSALPTTTPTLPTAATGGSTALLAEARIAVGRDPVTGQRLRATQSSSELWFSAPTGGSTRSESVANSSGVVQPARSSQAAAAAAQEPELSAYNTRAKTQVPKTGTRYDLFLQSLRMKQQLHPNFKEHANKHEVASGRQTENTRPATRTNSAPEPAPETSAYISKLSQTRKNMGTRYDLFVKEMRERAKQEREERERRERQFSWYAPERGPVEYYAPRPGGGR